MKKLLFAMIACCLAVSTAFAQQLNIEAQLSEDKPSHETPILDQNDNDLGRIFIRINDEPDDQGRTPVQIELKHSSDMFEFILFDRDWPKKELRKNCIVLGKYFDGENSKKVQGIELLNKGSINEVEIYRSYKFREISIEEGKPYECKIPIHLAKQKHGLFCPDKKKLYGIIYCTINISVDNRDEIYEKLIIECDSLLDDFDEALEREEFCTNPLHEPSIDDQVKEYIVAKDELKASINRRINDKGWPKESKSYKRYKVLLDSLDKMNVALEQYDHDCGGHQPKKIGSCGYCKLSLMEIYNELDRYYKRLYTNQVEISEIWNKVQALYRCGTTHKHVRKNEDQSYKKSIIETYNKIKEVKTSHE